jgi:hypothetical protein
MDAKSATYTQAAGAGHFAPTPYGEQGCRKNILSAVRADEKAT